MDALSWGAGLRGKRFVFLRVVSRHCCGYVDGISGCFSARSLVEMELDLPLTQSMHFSGFKSAAR